MTTVVVFGGSGFLGRRIVHRLLATGASVRVAVRYPESARSALPAADLAQVVFFEADVRDPTSVGTAMSGAHAVVNAVSAYVEKAGVTFQVRAREGRRDYSARGSQAWRCPTRARLWPRC